MSNSQWYRVYKLRFNLAMQDPDMPIPRFHTQIFIETNAEGPGTGTKHHVIGDIVTGMYYESKPCHNPDRSESLYSKELLGYTNASIYPQEFDKILSGIPAPPRQKAFNAKTMRTEPVKSWEPLTFYEPGEPRQPLVKCTEWTEQQAIPTLSSKGLIVQRR
ncbi:hypothetical protein OCS_06522 [Ophiocordyceps sinensis CO18]|uniref:Uncharacterized protein n=1 Tax=Ophiocordyceps sinensis (strain Co18 / CGMCC 3.14243) TaxID=911162 RepID=T5A7Q5_OPHSC|nr:hypothetical protein OCS_06522 [Ophiocordyceps sinensis CO18]